MSSDTETLSAIREIVEEWNNHGQGSAIKMNNIAAIIGEQPPAASQPNGSVTDKQIETVFLACGVMTDEQIIELSERDDFWKPMEGFTGRYELDVVAFTRAAFELAAPQPPAASQPSEAAFYINPVIIDSATGKVGKHIKSDLTWSRTSAYGWKMPVYLAPPHQPPAASQPTPGTASKDVLEGWK